MLRRCPRRSRRRPGRGRVGGRVMAAPSEQRVPVRCRRARTRRTTRIGDGQEQQHRRRRPMITQMTVPTWLLRTLNWVDAAERAPRRRWSATGSPSARRCRSAWACSRSEVRAAGAERPRCRGAIDDQVVAAGLRRASPTVTGCSRPLTRVTWKRPPRWTWSRTAEPSISTPAMIRRTAPSVACGPVPGGQPASRRACTEEASSADLGRASSSTVSLRGSSRSRTSPVRVERPGGLQVARGQLGRALPVGVDRAARAGRRLPGSRRGRPTAGQADQLQPG